MATPSTARTMPGGGPYGDLFTHLEVNGFDGMPYSEEGHCSICYESFSALQMACLPDCNHTFCRDCLIGHVRAKMSDLIYPIYCPLCAVDFQVVTKTEIDQRTLNHLRGELRSEDYEKFEILQLSLYAMSLQCPDCKHDMMIAREDLDNVLVTCPVTACGAQWCRACNSTISSCTRTHKCKQDAKFRRLMRRKRWRYCPGCRTPIQREQGCSHMTCRVPGCNTHFCYRCGGNIWKPGQGGDAYDAATFHNRWCRMVFPFGCPLM